MYRYLYPQVLRANDVISQQRHVQRLSTQNNEARIGWRHAVNLVSLDDKIRKALENETARAVKIDKTVSEKSEGPVGVDFAGQH